MFSFDNASVKGRDVMDGMVKSYADVTLHFQAIATESAEFSKKVCMDGVAHIEAITSVSSPEAALELQLSYLRSSYETGVNEMTRIAGMYADLAKLAYKPFEAPVAKKQVSKPVVAPVTEPVAAVDAA